MIAALALFGYALAVSWFAPAPLARLTGPGVSVRLGLAAWLAAIGSALVAGGLGIQSLFRTIGADWPSLTRALCRSVAGSACTSVVYRSALYELVVGAAAILVTAAAVVVAWRYGRRTQRARSASRAHARAALVTGRPLPGTGAVVLDDPRPAAYCVPGRPAAIVFTTGALALLDDAQLTAVLAHERAHLSGRHHAIVMAARALAFALPGIPLFTRGAAEVARLAEMSADDAAARRAGRGTLVAALLAIGTGTAVPSALLAAASYAVPARVERMLRPARPARAAAIGVALALVVTAATAMPVALLALTG